MPEHKFSLERWQEVADYVLPVLMAEEMHTEGNSHFWKAQQAGLLSVHFPHGKWRDMYLAVNQLVVTGKAVHITTLNEILAGKINDQAVMQWYGMYRDGSTLRGHVFDTHVKTLMEYGERYRLIVRAKQLVEDLQSPQEITHVTSTAISDFINSGVDVIENDTAVQLADDFEQFLSGMPQRNMTTGVQVLDHWINGFTETDCWSIAAPMKQRKTSLVLNILLHMARKRDLSVSLLMFESNKRMAVAQIVAMLAMEYLVANNLYGKNIVGEKDLVPVEQITAHALVRIQHGYKSWDKTRVDAVDYGIEEWRKLGTRFRIYDKSKSGGSLNDCASVQRIALRDKALYNTTFMAIDHAQRINEPGSDYEKMIRIAPYVETLARRESINTCLLAQLNASTAEGTGNTHMTGVRGGSVLDEAVDYMVITGYKQKVGEGDNRYPPNKLIVGLQHSRYGDGGPHKRAIVDIDPHTGLILNNGKGTQLGNGNDD